MRTQLRLVRPIEARFNAAVAAVLISGVLISCVLTGPATSAQGSQNYVLADDTSAATATPQPGWPDTETNQQLYPGGLWRNPDSLPVAAEAQLRASGETVKAATISQISSQPIATWLSQSWSTAAMQKKIGSALAAAQLDGTTPVFVVYAIPNRDCGCYSAGGYTESQYLQYNRDVGNALAWHAAVVLLERDSISTLGNASFARVAASWLPLLNTVAKDYWQKGVPIYLDGGHSSWMAPSVMAERLTAAEQKLGSQVSALLGGKHFVIDVSRNGNGAQPGWCNPTNAGARAESLSQTP